ncbi:MAG TPA: L,D-transpeptidase family protein [Novosphingobium sp.]|nr:L,D-transpeptidase family protein [Novosphingobium sp.]
MRKAAKPIVRPRRSFIGAALAAISLTVLPQPLQAAPASSAPPQHQLFEAELMRPENAGLRQFYYYRDNRPLWTAAGQLGPAADAVVHLVETAGLDDIAPDQVFATQLRQAVSRARAEGTPEALDAAELALSRSFAAYVRLTRETPDGVMLYEHVSLQPREPGVALALQEAAKAPSLAQYVRNMGWLHPFYAPMRKAFEEAGGSEAPMRRTFLANLARIRGLPAVPPGGRYVLVNAAAARLWMYEGDKPVDSMKVVVGRTDHQTPMMSGYIRYAILNPYWNLPADFTRDKLAPRVLKGGAAYLRKGGYQVMSDWTEHATLVDPQKIDWIAIAAGATDLRVRQLPGAANSMGRVKFEFPNQLGIYLHDTPEQELMGKETRLYSSGCIRLEDAQRLGRWLFKGAMPAAAEPEQRVDLPQLVPVYVTYLTLQPEADGQVIVLGDPYGRDVPSEPALAAQSGGFKASR